MVATGVMDSSSSFTLAGDAIRLENQAPQSAVVIKLIDNAVAKAAPIVTARVPLQSKVGETLTFSVQADPGGVPALRYHWNLGDENDLRRI
jgi:hypothetical protein